MSTAIKVLLCLLGYSLLPTLAADASKNSAEPQKPSDKPIDNTVVEILRAEIVEDNSPAAKDAPPKYKILGPANIKILRVGVRESGGGKFTAGIGTEDFVLEGYPNTLVVKIGEKNLRPYGYGGRDGIRMIVIELRDLDRATAELLTSAALPAAPKEQLQVEFVPDGAYEIGKPMPVSLNVFNKGDTALEFDFATDGGGNYPCRDTQLAFRAAKAGDSVISNPKPLPPGFIVHRFMLKPKSSVKRSVDISEWLRFKKPGRYTLVGDYSIELKNPVKDALPAQWQVTYTTRFEVEIKP